MKVRFSRLSLLGLSIALVAVLMSTSAALAQSTDAAGPFAALTGVMLLFVVVFGLAMYIYMALALQTIATKTGTANEWLAWIPIANLFLMLSIAKKPMWWFILLLIPLVGAVMAIIVWMAIAEARGKPNWWGILLIVPVANFVVPGYLAWAD
jgi:ABC-type Na+ efflux pump permease subunit